ncbi:MAG: glycine cleavage system aminomethyltransferase GcvT, partial [Bacteroidota bacterium]|nr:glycine cleavage system aminomethyltransferase GcvT [Bacteroidota bacterium]
FSKGEFISKPVLEKIKAEGVKRKLVGMMLPGRTVARHGYTILSDGETVGTVTSGTFSPSLEKGIAMGYVTAAHAAAGSTVAVDIRGTVTEAKIVAFPFLSKASPHEGGHLS